MDRPTVELLRRNDEIAHNSIPYQSINHTKSDKPSDFTDINFSFNTNQNQHRAPSKSLNDERNHLSNDITASIITESILP